MKRIILAVCLLCGVAFTTVACLQNPFGDTTYNMNNGDGKINNNNDDNKDDDKVPAGGKCSADSQCESGDCDDVLGICR